MWPSRSRAGAARDAPPARGDGGSEPSELTLRAVVIGFAVGMVLASTITYLALYSGLAISAAIPAALVCTAIMRMGSRRVPILENNISQTIASSGEALSLGVVFTIPALVLTGARRDLSYWEVSAVAALGGAMGVLFTILLRRTLVSDPRLRYPESVASARISVAGGRPRADMGALVVATAAGAAFKALVSVVQVVSGTVEAAVRVGGRVLYAGTEVSLALLAVGLIVELDVVWLVLLGGTLSWLVAVPLLADPAAAAHDPAGAAWAAWRSQVRFLGVGGLIAGACWSSLQARHAFLRGARQLFRGLVDLGGEAMVRTEADLPTGWVVAAIGAAAAGTFLVMLAATDAAGQALLVTVVVLALVGALSAASGHIVGLVGSSNNPVSGMAVCGLLAVSVVFVLLRAHADARLTASVLLAAALVATATSTAGDTAQHLKAGAILGAAPRSQQVAQLLGVIVFAVLVAPLVVLLQRAYGIAAGTHDSLAAPQAALFASLSEAVFTVGGLPWQVVWIGAGIGVAVILADWWLRRTGWPVRLHVMPVAIGMYLPFSLSATLLLGGLLGFAAGRLARRGGAAGVGAARDRAVLLGCGLIAGEAIVGLATAIPRWLGWNVPVRILDSPPLSLAALAAAALAVLLVSSRAGGRSPDGP